MPFVRIPPPYRGPTQGHASVDVDGATVGACLDAVERKHPGFLAQVVDDDGNVHRFVKLFKNGEQVQRDPLRTPLAATDDLEIIAAIAGG
ncbi:MAG TPA: MoaD/ThiS family protein [Myxococcota bacterium]|jgi:molybdopterin synthase sulfur carrier subunit